MFKHLETERMTGQMHKTHFLLLFYDDMIFMTEHDSKL